MPVQQQGQVDPWGATPTAASDPWSPVKEVPRASPQPNLVAAPANNAMVSNNDPWSTLGAGQGGSSNGLGGTGNDVNWGFSASTVGMSNFWYRIPTLDGNYLMLNFKVRNF